MRDLLSRVFISLGLGRVTLSWLLKRTCDWLSFQVCRIFSPAWYWTSNEKRQIFRSKRFVDTVKRGKKPVGTLTRWHHAMVNCCGLFEWLPWLYAGVFWFLMNSFFVFAKKSGLLLSTSNFQEAFFGALVSYYAIDCDTSIVMVSLASRISNLTARLLPISPRHWPLTLMPRQFSRSSRKPLHASLNW